MSSVLDAKQHQNSISLAHQRLLILRPHGPHESLRNEIHIARGELQDIHNKYEMENDMGDIFKENRKKSLGRGVMGEEEGMNGSTTLAGVNYY